jgi:polyisoprenoid-binding protein YceI
VKEIFYIFLLLKALLVTSQRINEQKSFISFKVGSMGFNSVRGEIRGMVGDLKFNPDSVSLAYFDVSINPATIDTKNNARDEHLVGDDFFDVLLFHSISFKSSFVEKIDNHFVAHGRLTLCGITRDLAIPFDFDSLKKSLEGNIKLNRFDFGLAEKSYGSFMVSKITEITINCYLID